MIPTTAIIVTQNTGAGVAACQPHAQHQCPCSNPENFLISATICSSPQSLSSTSMSTPSADPRRSPRISTGVHSSRTSSRTPSNSRPHNSNTSSPLVTSFLPPTSMPPPSSKRAASADSGNHYPKRVKISPGREAFDTALDKFLGLLDGVDMAYDFIPADHAQKTLKASPITQIPFLKFALAKSKGNPLLVMFCLREADLSFPLFRELKLHPEFQSQFPGNSFSDQGEVFRKLVNESCGEVLKIGEELFPLASHL
jgi:hypothetical protein